MSDLPKKLGKSSDKNAEKGQVIPTTTQRFRFDSAPTRVRFDSAPTRLRLDEKGSKNMSNAIKPESTKIKGSDDKRKSEKESSDIKKSQNSQSSKTVKPDSSTNTEKVKDQAATHKPNNDVESKTEEKQPEIEKAGKSSENTRESKNESDEITTEEATVTKDEEKVKKVKENQDINPETVIQAKTSENVEENTIMMESKSNDENESDKEDQERERSSSRPIECLEESQQSQSSGNLTDQLKNDGQDSNDSSKNKSCLLATIKKLEDRIKRTSTDDMDDEPEHESEVEEMDEGSDDERKKSCEKLDEVVPESKSSTPSIDSQDEDDGDGDGDGGVDDISDKSGDKTIELGDNEKLMEIDEDDGKTLDATEEMLVHIKDENEESDNLIEMVRDDSNLPFEICDVRTVQDMDDSSKEKSEESHEESEPSCEIAATLNKILDEITSKETKSADESDVVVVTQSSLKTIVKTENGDGYKVEESSKKPRYVMKPKIVERLCMECDRLKCCKYKVQMTDNIKYLCDDSCYKAYENRTKLTMSLVLAPENRPITRSLTQSKDFCSICRKEIKNGVGFLSGVGENKPLCSEECMRKYYMLNAPKRGCAQCGNAIQGRNKCLTWETMEFCNEECLGKYQSFLGSHCAKCRSAVVRTSLGKYCVRFGSDIKQFCCNGCLEEFKKTLRVCTFCQKDISTRPEGPVAHILDKGVWKDFCSRACVDKFEVMNKKKLQPNVQKCSVCNKIVAIKVQVNFEGKAHCLCSDPCIAAFRYANKISTSICDSCHKFFHVDASQPYTIQFEGLSKRFCAKSCMNVFVLSHRKIVPCTWCKVKKYNFDMIERVDSNNHVQLFCSLNCLSLFRVSLNATSAKSVRCDHCRNSQPAQYHLTMSDASIRNFCSYQCVMTFQRPFTNIAPVKSKVVATTIATTSTVTTLSVSQTASNPTSNITPVIASVRSLAPVTQSQPVIVVPNRQAPGTSLIATSTTTANATTKSLVVAPSTATTATQATAQVLIKPPAPKQMKNKSLMCRPFMQTKGVSCKPHPCHKNVQTDPEEEKVVTKPVIIPVPVPIYVPVPMHMYVRPVPVPIPFSIPVPVPIFIPTSKNTAEEISKQMKEIQEKIPNNPFEAELLMMAEMVANNNKSGANKSGSTTSTSTPAGTSNGEQGQVSSDAEQSEQFGMENQISDGMHATNAFSDDMLQMALRMATEMDEPAMDVESALGSSGHQSSHDTAFNSIEENNSDVLTPRELRARNRGQKRSGSNHRGRGRKKPRTDENSLQMTPGGMVTPADSNSILKYTYGVNAWKHWVLEKNTQLEKASQNNRKLKLFKTDLLQLTADELNYSLCLFVKEVRKPNREEYASDSIFYLCLGIQQYLFENGRIDNIFTDAYYEKFTECLNEVLQKGDAIGGLDGVIASRIEEEMLWEAKQLGAHSPHVLLNTLMYFNAKFFLLRTVEDHMRLSFSHVLKQWKKSGSLSPARAANQSTPGRNVFLRYCPPSHNKGEVGRKRKDDQSSLEQVENLDNPLRCPVKLYEFYLSKCPESIRNRSDVFYLNPERSCVPDSPVWYSTMPLGKEAIAKMLQRIKNVREVCEVF